MSDQTTTDPTRANDAPAVTVDDDGTQVVDGGHTVDFSVYPGDTFEDEAAFLSVGRIFIELARDEARALARLAPALRTFAEFGTLIAPEAT